MIRNDEWKALAARTYTPMHGTTWVDENGDYGPVLRLLEARGEIDPGLRLDEILALMANGRKDGPVKTAMRELSYAFGMDYPSLCHFIAMQIDDFNLSLQEKAEG